MTETKKGGRPRGTGWSRLDRFRAEIEELIQNGSTKVFIANKFGFTVPGLYQWLKKNKMNLKPSV